MTNEQRGPSQGSERTSAERHVDLLVAIWQLYSVLLFFGGLLVTGALLMLGGWDYHLAGGMVLLVFGLAVLVAALGVRARRRWARVLLIVLAVISLGYFPIGTAIGGYTLWALLKHYGARLFSGDVA